MLKYQNKDFGLFLVGNKVYKITKRMAQKYDDYGVYHKASYTNPDPCYMTCMNRKVMDKLTAKTGELYSWQDAGGGADYYASVGNYFD